MPMSSYEDSWEKKSIYSGWKALRCIFTREKEFEAIRSEQHQCEFIAKIQKTAAWKWTVSISGLTSGKAKSPKPDLSKCQYPTDLPSCASVKGGCSPPFIEGTIPVNFTFPTTSLPMRTRKAAHLLDEESIEKKLMKKLPADDPRSFTQQAKLHCAYCNGAYPMGSSEFQVDGSWSFAPFHHWYLYFYERILGSLIQDDTFALPFWNSDAEEGMQIPPIYTDKCSSPASQNYQSRISNLLRHGPCGVQLFCHLYSHEVWSGNSRALPSQVRGGIK
ncbi:hypothetical protein SUGI_0570310 [Cryptomeria japonica]|nr:hypothetical protein SUGI_0570310 [Cryptomeria japonica]